MKPTIASIVDQINLQAGLDPAAKTVTRVQHERALTIARNLAAEQGRSESYELARLAERSRLKAITQHTDAAGKQELADYLAFETNMPADEAIKTLSAAPAARKKLSVLDALVVQMNSSGKNDSALDADLSVAIDRLVASRFRGAN